MSYREKINISCEHNEEVPTVNGRYTNCFINGAFSIILEWYRAKLLITKIHYYYINAKTKLITSTFLFCRMSTMKCWFCTGNRVGFIYGNIYISLRCNMMLSRCCCICLGCWERRHQYKVWLFLYLYIFA